MSLRGEVGALRSSAGLSRAAHVAVAHVDGPGALDLLERATPRPLHLREGRARHTLLLREDASILADAYVGSGDDGYYLLAEGPIEDELVAWLRTVAERAAGREARVRGLSSEHALLAVDGPFAWEVVAKVLGASVLGMPYLTFLRRDEALCLRAGKTGEYGYLLLVERSAVGDLERKLLEAGRGVDMEEVHLPALDVCALENAHFSIRTLRETSLGEPLTPIELQLQWRVGYGKDFVGAEALRARRERGASVRATCFTADGPVAPGQAVMVHDREVGEVLAASESPTMGGWLGCALLRKRVAHPHVEVSIASVAGSVAAVTQTVPLVDNLSLRVDPNKHSYATRHLIGSKTKVGSL
jgi:aminomethyltransferase